MERYFNKTDLDNLCSFLLLVSPEELVIIAIIISFIISNNFTVDETIVISSFLSTIGNNLQLLAAQKELFDSVNEAENELIQRERDKLNKAIEEKEKVNDAIEMEKLKDEVKSLQEQLTKLENILKKQIKT